MWVSSSLKWQRKPETAAFPLHAVNAYLPPHALH